MQRLQLLKISRQISRRIFGQILPIIGLSLSALALPSCTFNQPPKPFSSEALPTEAIAEISEIRSYPVRVKYLNAAAARPATVGLLLKANESIITDDTSNAQVTLRSGTIIRIGGKSSLTIKPENQVEFTSGQLVAWAASDRKAPIQVQTPFGEISSNNGTIYLEIPDKAAEDRRVIALDGTVTVLLKSTSQSQIVTIAKGEEISIKANGRASAPKRIEKESINKRIVNNPLIFGFAAQLASLPQITSEFGVTASVKEANTIEFRRSDLPKISDNRGNKVTYKSGTANNNQKREEQPDRRREEPYTEAETEPKPTTDTNNTAPVTNTVTTEPVPLKPNTPPPLATPPTTPPTTPTATPIEPTPSQPSPLEPPPQPVQPEVPVPVAPIPKR